MKPLDVAQQNPLTPRAKRYPDAVRPYPWHALDSVPREMLAALRTARESLFAVTAPSSLAHALSQLIDQPVELVASRLATSRHPQANTNRDAICLLSFPRSQRLLLVIEAELAAHLTCRILQHRPALVHPQRPTPDMVQACVGAAALALVRRLGVLELPTLQAIGEAALADFANAPGPFVAAQSTVLIGPDAYRAALWVDAQSLPTHGAHPFGFNELLALGEMPLRMTMVAALVSLPVAAVGSMRVGDALMPGSAWWVARAAGELTGELVLCSPSGANGMPAKLIEGGKIVVGKGLKVVDADQEQAPTQLNEASSEPSCAVEALADAPLLVRVELGTVTLSARQWAQLRPGDVLPTGNRLAELATLRVAGRDVAHGELVDIDGELGVRIHDLVGSQTGGMP